jgi:hypothetical protein
MQLQDDPAPPPVTPRGPSRAVWVAAIATALVVAAVAWFLTTRSDGEAVGSLPPESSVPPTTASPTTTTVDTETEVVARLREILGFGTGRLRPGMQASYQTSTPLIAHASRETEMRFDSSSSVMRSGEEFRPQLAWRVSNRSMRDCGL